MTHTTPETTDILIVGAGPTGLALAWSLHRQGIVPRIIDAGSGPSAESRALALHARTLEVLGESLAGELIEMGQKIDKFNIHSDKTRLAELSLNGSPTRYPFALGLPQSKTERLLVSKLEAAGILVEWDTRLVSLTQDDDAVYASLEGQGGARIVTASWVVGCDGVRSVTREAAGISVAVELDSRWWSLADVRLEGDDVPAQNTGNVFASSEGAMAFFPLDTAGWWRIVAVGDGDGERPDVTQARMEELLKRRCMLSVQIAEASWLSCFRIREQVVDAYRRGRVFVAGDAAHAHSPLGGQGMNTGIQDACNLSWKLAVVMRGADEGLLDSYEAERLPVAQALVAQSGRGTRAMYASAPWLVWLRNTAVRHILGVDWLAARFRNAIEMLTVAYPDSPIVGEAGADAREALVEAVEDQDVLELPDASARRAFRRAAAPGERAPSEVGGLHTLMDTPRHTALCFDGAEGSEAGYGRMKAAAAQLIEQGHVFRPVFVVPSAEAGQRATMAGVDVLIDADGALHDAFGAQTETLVIVRPDGVIGWRSQPIDLAACLSWWRTAVGAGSLAE